MTAPDARSVTRPAKARVFFALWPETGVSRALHRLARDAQAECGGRLMRRETLHLTLTFVGDISRERVDTLLSIGNGLRFAPFAIAIDRLASWRHNGIVWAGTESAPVPLLQLADDLSRRLVEAGFAIESRKFAAHVTLLRRIGAPFSARAVGPIHWPVGEVVLVESERDAGGSRYRVIGRWPARA